MVYRGPPGGQFGGVPGGSRGVPGGSRGNGGGPRGNGGGVWGCLGGYRERGGSASFFCVGSITTLLHRRSSVSFSVCFDNLQTYRSGGNTMGYCIPPFMVWNKGAKTSGSRPRGFRGAWYINARIKLDAKTSSFEERRERPRPVAWPKTPPGQYQPSPMFGFTPKRGVKKCSNIADFIRI